LRGWSIVFQQFGRKGGDSRWRLRRQLKLELLDQKLELRLGLGIAGQPQLPPIGRRQMNIDHLDGSKFLQSATCGQPRGQGMQASLQRDLRAVSEERDEDMCLDPTLVLMEDRTSRRILFQVLNASSTATGWI
jgi:hypothetical protein